MSRQSKRPYKVRQACDACHGRKIRCDGCRPCINCRQSEIDCTYLAVPSKTGPKGPRRARRPPQQLSSLPLLHPPLSPHQISSRSEAKGPSPLSLDTTFKPAPVITRAVIDWCLDAYFKHKYPLTPILNRQELEKAPNSPAQYGLIVACCAVIALSPEILPPSSTQNDVRLPPADLLISETLRARQHCDLVEHPSLTHIQTSFFLYAAFFCLDKDNSAWYYLQEAMTMLHTLRLHQETTYSHVQDPMLVTYGRRMFWVLFITERAYALQRNRPIRLKDTLKLPIIIPLSPDADILLGFLHLISLFRPFDSDFVDSWNSAAPSTSTDPTHLPKLQTLLTYTLPNLSNYSQVQQADLLISRQWLKLVVWKLCASTTILSTADCEDVMSLHYPASIARNIVLVSQLVSTQAFEANGIGILEKVFDVACSLADLLSLGSLGSQESTMQVGAIDTLMEMVRIVGTRFGGSYRHLDMLVDKANRCLCMEVDRSLPSPSEEFRGDVDEIFSPSA
ncbi:hypothetical protein F66182_2413 [Fusarium sp. NRRL 66182]|nr:hypothetical protein F66182_2413 [Fusarium sp. NRRL 66182]